MNKKNKKATSIVEAMIVMLIIVVGIIGLYNIFNESQKLSNTTKNRIEAIEIAREGIEAMKNIRDTNWIMFAGDKNNCWNTWDYDPSCVGGNFDIGTSSYKIYRQNNKWYIDTITSDNYNKISYRNQTKVGLDKNGFYTQSGIVTDLKPIFTRELQIQYLDNNKNSLPNPTDTSEIMQVTSLVQWADSSGTHKVKLTDLLTNWQK